MRRACPCAAGHCGELALSVGQREPEDMPRAVCRVPATVGGLSKEQLRTAFSAVDSGDGTIDMSELCKLLSKFGHELTHAQMAAKMRDLDMDTDGSGDIGETLPVGFPFLRCSSSLLQSSLL